MKDGFYKGNPFGNRNLPCLTDGIIGTRVCMEGNLITTYYRINGEIFGVSDWPRMNPEMNRSEKQDNA